MGPAVDTGASPNPKQRILIGETGDWPAPEPCLLLAGRLAFGSGGAVGRPPAVGIAEDGLAVRVHPALWPPGW